MIRNDFNINEFSQFDCLFGKKKIRIERLHFQTLWRDGKCERRTQTISHKANYMVFHTQFQYRLHRSNNGMHVHQQHFSAQSRTIQNICHIQLCRTLKKRLFNRQAADILFKTMTKIIMRLSELCENGNSFSSRGWREQVYVAQITPDTWFGFSKKKCKEEK